MSRYNSQKNNNNNNNNKRETKRMRRKKQPRASVVSDGLAAEPTFHFIPPQNVVLTFTEFLSIEENCIDFWYRIRGDKTPEQKMLRDALWMMVPVMTTCGHNG